VAGERVRRAVGEVGLGVERDVDRVGPQEGELHVKLREGLLRQGGRRVSVRVSLMVRHHLPRQPPRSRVRRTEA
jgi:hypothetical protein